MHVLLTHTPFNVAGSRFARNAAIGAVAWCAGLLLHPDWATAAIQLAALVLVPLAMRLIEDGKKSTRAWRAAALLQPWAAILLLPAFVLPQGPAAGALAIAWTSVTALLAMHGLLRFCNHRLSSPATVAHDAGLVMAIVGGAFTFVTRMGWRPLDFEPAIVQLTAVHFHYAGFVLPVVAGLAAREFPGRASSLMIAGIVIGMPLVALGIIFSRTLELAAVVGFTLACMLVATRQFKLAGRAPDAVSYTLFSISAAALVAAMLLAPLYALGRFSGSGWLAIADMLPTHGACNAFGFALCGLLAWQRITAARSRSLRDRDQASSMPTASSCQTDRAP